MVQKLRYILLFVTIMSGIGHNVYAQTQSYNSAIKSAAKNLETKIAADDIVAVIEIRGSSKQFNDRVINDFIDRLLKDEITMVDRQDLDKIHAEIEYQESGYVSDDSAISLGNELGATAIILGSGERQPDYYRIDFKMLSVETTKILKQTSVRIRYDSSIRRLLDSDSYNASDIGSTHFAVGARLGAGFEINTAHEDMVGDGISPNETSNIAFNATLYGAFRFNDVWSIQPEVNFMLNNGMEISGHTDPFKIAYPTIDIPLLLRWNFIQSPLVVGVVAGPYISFPIGKLNLTLTTASGGSGVDMEGYTWGITGGFAFGKKIGSGHLTADVRYLNDFNSLQVREEEFDDGSDTQGQNILIRRSINVTVGYEFSL